MASGSKPGSRGLEVSQPAYEGSWTKNLINLLPKTLPLSLSYHIITFNTLKLLTNNERDLSIILLRFLSELLGTHLGMKGDGRRMNSIAADAPPLASLVSDPPTKP